MRRRTFATPENGAYHPDPDDEFSIEDTQQDSATDTAADSPETIVEESPADIGPVAGDELDSPDAAGEPAEPAEAVAEVADPDREEPVAAADEASVAEPSAAEPSALAAEEPPTEIAAEVGEVVPNQAAAAHVELEAGPAQFERAEGPSAGAEPEPVAESATEPGDEPPVDPSYEATDAVGGDAVVAEGTDGGEAAADDDADDDVPEERDPHADLLAWLGADDFETVQAQQLEPEPEHVEAVHPEQVAAEPAQSREVPSRPMPSRPKPSRYAARAEQDAAVPTLPLSPSPPAMSVPGGMSNNRRTLLALGGAILAAVLVIAIFALVLPDSTKTGGAGAKRSSARPSASQPVSPGIGAQQISWVRANLPLSASIVAPPDVAKSLLAAKYGHAHSDSNLAGLGPKNVSYLVGEPTVVDRVGALRGLVSATAPLAIFGSGNGQTMIGQVFSGGAGNLARKLSADAKLRAEEGSDILRNSRIRADAGTRKVLAAGLLDSRAGALLVTMAINQVVTVSDPQRDPAEAAAGLPYRTVTISMSSATYLDASLSAAGQQYRPATIDKLNDQQRRVTWRPAVAPDTPFS